MNLKNGQAHGLHRAPGRGVSVDADAPKKLSLSQCRRLLGSGTSIDDANLARLRDELYKLAEVALEGFRHREKRNAEIRPLGGQATSASGNWTSVAMVPEAEREAVVERAAILELEAGLSRDLAERNALLEWAGRRKTDEKRPLKIPARLRRAELK